MTDTGITGTGAQPLRAAITIIAAVAIAGYALAGCGTIRAPLSYELPRDCVHDTLSTLCGQ